MQQRELDRCGMDRHPVRVAQLPALPGPLQHPGGNRVIVEHGVGRGVGQQARVEDTADDHRGTRPGAHRQQCRERLVVEEGEAARDEYDVGLELRHVRGERTAVVHAESDGPDQTLVAQSAHRRIGRAADLVRVLLRVVQIEDVDAGAAQAAQARLQGLPDAALGPVGDHLAGGAVR